MRPIDDNDNNKANPIIDSDTETQSPSPSHASSGEELNDWDADVETIALGGETQLLDFDDETQILEYLEYDDENVRTQLLDVSDGEGTDKTEILSDGGGGTDDQRGVEEDYVDDSDASTGYVQKSSLSVPAASLQGPAQAADPSVSAKETNEEAISLPNFMSGKKHFDHENGGSLRDPVSLGKEVEIDSDNNVQSCGNNTIIYNGKTQCGVANSAEREIFDEDEFTGKNEAVNDDDCYNGTSELPESPAYVQKFAGLSYIGSQEPGEFSQANALGFVDNFLATNDVGLSQEGGCRKTLRELSPPLSRAKVAQSLAKISVIKSPVRDVKIYDWDDSYIDKGFKGFSDGIEGTSNKSRGISQISLGQPQESRYSNRSKGRGTSNKPNEKKTSNLKSVNLTCSDTRETLNNSKQHDKMMQTFGTSTTKNLSDDLDEELNVDPQMKPSEGTGMGMDFPGAYDIGFDTQVAAEAMEVLCHVVPPIRDTKSCNQVPKNLTCGSPRAGRNNKLLTKGVNDRKRVFSDSVSTKRRSNRTREVVTEVNNLPSWKDLQVSEKKEPRPAKGAKRKLTSANSKAEEHRINRISGDGKVDVNCGSHKSVRHRKTRAATGKLQNKGSDGCDSLNISNANYGSERRAGDDSGPKPSKSYSRATNSTCSNIKSTLHSSMMPISETSIMKNISDGLGELPNVVLQEKPFEGTGIGMDLPGAYDIGFDTQVAAEAMEVLCHEVPPIRDINDEKATCSSPRSGKNNEALTESVNARKRLSSDSGGTRRRSNRTREVVTEVNNLPSREVLKVPEEREPRPATVAKRKLRSAKSKAEEHRINEITIDEKEDMNRGSTKSVKHRKTRAATGKLQNKSSDGCDSFNMSNANHGCERRVGDDSRSKLSENKSFPKAMNSTCLDTRPKLDNSKQHDKMMPSSETSTMKNISDDLSKLPNVVLQEKPFEGTGIGVDLPGEYDIGFDTQVAVEAMEALCHGVSPSRDAENCCQVLETTTCGFPRAGKDNEALTESVNVMKRVSSDSGGTTRLSNRATEVVTEVNNFLPLNELRGLELREPVSAAVVKSKSKSAKAKTEEHQRSGINVDGKGDESTKHRKTRAATVKLQNKESDRCDRSLTSNANREVSERRIGDKSGSFTPIACRTRRSKALKQSTGLEFLNESGATNDLMQASICGVKRRDCSAGSDAPTTSNTKGRSNQLGSIQISRARISKLIQPEPPGNNGTQDRGATNEKCDFLSYSKGKRTRRDQSDIECSDLVGQFTIAGGEDIHGQYIPRRKRSKIDAKGSAKFKSSADQGRKLDVITRSFPDGTGGKSMLRIVPGDEAKSPNASSVALFNCSHSLKTPSPTPLGREIMSCKAAPVSTLKGLSKKRDMAEVRVLLSQHLDEDIIKQQKKISSRLGLPIAPSSSEATHFIADKFVRTRNMLEAIAFGKPVVTHLWLESCGKANCLVDEANYILRDSEKEKEIGFSMPVSLSGARARHGQLLQGKRVFITPNVKPSRELVSSLVTSVHGQVVKRIGNSVVKDDKVVDDLLVLSCEEDYATCVPLLLKSAAVYSSELLLNGIIIQKLEYERHRLFKDHNSKRTDRAKRTR